MKENEFNRELGRKLRDVRKRKKISQAHLSDLVCIHRNTLLHWEKGDGSPGPWMLLQICDALSVPLWEIIP